MNNFHKLALKYLVIVYIKCNSYHLMKKVVIISIILSACIINVFGQRWIWSDQLKCNGDVFPSGNVSIDIVTDNLNNVYYCGHYDSNPLTVGDITIQVIGMDFF